MALDVSHEKEEIRALQFEWFEHRKTSIFSSKHVIWQEIKLLIKEARRNAKYLRVNLEPSSASTWFNRRNLWYQWFFSKFSDGGKKWTIAFLSIVSSPYWSFIALGSRWATCVELRISVFSNLKRNSRNRALNSTKGHLDRATGAQILYFELFLPRNYSKDLHRNPLEHIEECDLSIHISFDFLNIDIFVLYHVSLPHILISVL